MNHLLIFAKYPEPGRVKTRLAQKVGFERAASLYRDMIEKVVRDTQPTRANYQQFLCIHPPHQTPSFKSWFPFVRHLHPQKGRDLGEKLNNAFQNSFHHGSQKTVVIGSDCLDIDENLILKSFQHLKYHDLVLGPAQDGGYYLLGTKHYYPELFHEIPWSTSDVLKKTLHRAKAQGLKTHLLSTLNDIDSYEDFLESQRA